MPKVFKINKLKLGVLCLFVFTPTPTSTLWEFPLNLFDFLMTPPLTFSCRIVVLIKFTEFDNIFLFR